MNIKEHIEAGHYPKDEKGRPLVPTADGRIYVVLATDNPTSLPIVGYCTNAPDILSRQRLGCHGFLLPPPPRKVKVTGWAIIDRCGCLRRICTNQHSSDVIGAPSLGNRVVELTGEYEEPWS